MAFSEIAQAGARKQPSLIAMQFQIWYAIMLHDIKARFFGNGLGFVITILWPLSHILVILVINIGRMAPHGASMLLYASTAVVPFIAANYVGRFILLGVVMNKPFLNYPIIKPLDLMIARTLLEIINNFIVVSVLAIGLTLFGVDIMPVDIRLAAEAWGCAVFLGIGMGFFNGVIAMAFPLWSIVYVLFTICAWATCGMTIDPEALPAEYGYYFSFNPVMHLVEWMRLAYYPSFNAHLLSKFYVICFAITCLGLGLVIERLARPFLIQPR